MNKQEKATPVFLILVLILLVLDFGFLLMEYVDYENRKEAGNARWEQVEERIEEMEECCDCGRNS